MAEELIDSIQDQINGQQLSLSKEINALSRILKKCLGQGWMLIRISMLRLKLKMWVVLRGPTSDGIGTVSLERSEILSASKYHHGSG